MLTPALAVIRAPASAPRGAAGLDEGFPSVALLAWLGHTAAEAEARGVGAGTGAARTSVGEMIAARVGV